MNRLKDATSPYLQQHVDNPVDWYEWGEEAFEAARTRDVPIFLSVGYSTCHWCHVMAHESFDDPETAAVMNAHFVNVKVDREERPDVDHLYMTILVAQTGHGGWPMSVWLTPELQPYFAGTYFPRLPRHGMPGFADVCRQMANAYRERRTDAVEQGQQALTWARAAMTLQDSDAAPVDESLFARAFEGYAAAFDARHGGFGGAPKFPRSMALSFLLRQRHRDGALSMVRQTLDGMARGGMYDQLDGGFCRYSTDTRWLVPHFEKMLYDNALLTATYLEAYQVAGAPGDLRVAREVIDYVRRRMTDAAGGFYSAEDADSEGEEGKFYVFDRQDIADALGDPDDTRLACDYYGVTDAGNFERTGKSVLHVAGPAPARLDDIRQRLLAARDRRVRPGRDDKVLVSWNGLMTSACCLAAQVTGEPGYADLARRAAAFVERELTTPDGGLLRAWRQGRAGIPAMLDDHAFHIRALIDLWETAFDPAHLRRAVALTERVLAGFADPDRGGFYQTLPATDLPVRTKETQDGAIPTGNSVMVDNLRRLAWLTDRPDWLDVARRTVAAYSARLERAPQALAQLLCAAADLAAPARQLVVVGPPDDPVTRALLREAQRRFRPGAVLASGDPAGDDWPARAALVPALGARAASATPTAYLCDAAACGPPLTDPDAWRAELARHYPASSA